MSETKEKKDTYMVAWYVILVVMFVITVASVVFSDSIYGEDSVFNSAPTGIPAIDGVYQLIPAFIDCVKVVFIVYIIGKVVQIVLAKALSGSNKGITAAKLINSFIKYAVAIIAILAVLSAAGVDTTTLVASAGILSLVIGLGAQSLIADIIAGLFTIFEGEYQVGDIVVVDGWRGTVEEIGIRSTRVVDAGGNTKIINNSEIKTVINQTQHLSVVSTTISIEYGENLPKVELIIRDNIDRIKAAIPQIVEGPFYKGVTALGANSVDLLFMSNCKEEDYFPVSRAMNRELKLLFDEYGISIPFPQIVVNQPVEFDKNSMSAYQEWAAKRFVDKQAEESKDIEEQNN